MKRIALIRDTFVRDTQIYTENPDVLEKEQDWGNNYADVQSPCLYIGEFKGFDEDEIRKKAADYQGVHPDAISFAYFKQDADGNIVDIYVCPVCENEEHSATARFCMVCGAKIQREIPENIDTFEFEHFKAHAGHKIELVLYGENRNVSLECDDCRQVLYSVDNPEIKKDEEENEITDETAIINKVFYKGGGDIPMTYKQMAKEAGFKITPADYPDRISGSGHCRCKNGGEFILSPKYDPAVIEGGKRYMQCRNCECWSHL